MSTSPLSQYSLGDIDTMYRDGRVSEDEVAEYLRAWNATPGRFTQAVLRDGGIRQFDPEVSKPYRELWDKFGVHESTIVMNADTLLETPALGETSAHYEMGSTAEAAGEPNHSPTGLTDAEASDWHRGWEAHFDQRTKTRKGAPVVFGSPDNGFNRWDNLSRRGPGRTSRLS